MNYVCLLSLKNPPITSRQSASSTPPAPSRSRPGRTVHLFSLPSRPRTPPERWLSSPDDKVRLVVHIGREARKQRRPAVPSPHLEVIRERIRRLGVAGGNCRAIPPLGALHLR